MESEERNHILNEFLLKGIVTSINWGYCIGSFFESRAICDRVDNAGDKNDWVEAQWFLDDDLQSTFLDSPRENPIPGFCLSGQVLTLEPGSPYRALETIKIPDPFLDLAQRIGVEIGRICNIKNALRNCDADGCDSLICEKTPPFAYGRLCSFHLRKKEQDDEMRLLLDKKKTQEAKNWHREHMIDGARVYFVQQGDYVKIGFTTKMENRLRDLQIGAPNELKLLTTVTGPRKTESKFHEFFRSSHHRGEWFDAKPVIEYLEQEGMLEGRPE